MDLNRFTRGRLDVTRIAGAQSHAAAAAELAAKIEPSAFEAASGAGLRIGLAPTLWG
jgi:hypothetical protein